MKEPSQTALGKSLKRKQRRHVELLAKVEKTRVRLDRRMLKLSVMESAIAELERCVAEPRKRGEANGEVSRGLRRAQLIFNPASGNDSENNAIRLSQIVSGLRTHGIEAVIGLKTSGKAARSLAREAVRD